MRIPRSRDRNGGPGKRRCEEGNDRIHRTIIAGHILQAAERILGTGTYNWSILSAGRMGSPLCATALFLGGSARVGMEDNLCLSKDVLHKNNAGMLKKTIRVMGEYDCEPASPKEARESLETNKNSPLHTTPCDLPAKQ